MSTLQELTTEQLEVLIVMDDVYNCIEEKNYELEVSIAECLDGILKIKSSTLEILEALENYGYIEYGANNDYVLTVAGKQYIKLFNEYLDLKESKPTETEVKKYPFISINIGQLNISLEACLVKFSFSSSLLNLAEKIRNHVKR